MKKILTVLIISIVLFSANIADVYADTHTVVTSDIIYISDDIYIETVIFEESASNTIRTTNSKTASKLYYIKNSDDEVLATFKLTGIFTYDGNASTCINATYTTSVSNDNWKFTSAGATRSGNTATGTFTAKSYLSGVTIQTVSQTITLSCDKNGNLS